MTAPRHLDPGETHMSATSPTDRRRPVRLITAAALVPLVLVLAACAGAGAATSAGAAE